MGTRDPRVDAYIGRSAAFARPILEHLRALVHRACPDVVETLKWGFPHFEHHGLLCSMASFKQHASFGFWRGSVLLEAKHRSDQPGMGQFGRLTSVRDLPPATVLTRYVKAAMKLNESGVKSAARPKTAAPKPAPRPPADLLAALRRNARARATFDAFSPGHRREYVEWITGAKRDETRRRRVEQAVQWMAEGKSHNWRYERKPAAAKVAGRGAKRRVSAKAARGS